MSADDATNRDVWITGLGLLSAAGEGPDQHLDALMKGKPLGVDEQRFAPYPVHALAEIDWSQQISRRDMRQMEPWQRIGTYAAGLALDDAGIDGENPLRGGMDMIVAAGGGERDIEVDDTLLTELRTAQNHDATMAERLSNDLRPTLFLAQLSNLLAGNISIVHKVTGSSRTFMGEEGAGISAVQHAAARISSGQSDIVLVGGAFNGERIDMMLSFELGHYLLKDEYRPVWQRDGAFSGFAFGSIGAFLVLESREHAEARGARAYAEIETIAVDHGPRGAGELESRHSKLLQQVEGAAILSAATGVADASNGEKAALTNIRPGAPVRAYGSLLGHSVEAQFPLGVALAALCASKGAFPPPFEEAEAAGDVSTNHLIVSCVGHWRAEGVAQVSAIAGKGEKA